MESPTTPSENQSNMPESNQEQIGNTSGNTGRRRGRPPTGRSRPAPERSLQEIQEEAEQRARRLYRKQLEGLTVRQLVFEHAESESISIGQAWRDWSLVKEWNQKDWDLERETMLARVNNMRLRVVDCAIRRGQLSTAADLLRQLGAAAGEGSELLQQQAAPQLNISVEMPGALPADNKKALPSESAEVLEVDAEPADQPDS